MQNDIAIAPLRTHLMDFTVRAGLDQAVGGRDALERGLDELLAGVPQIAGDLLAAEAARVDLADAVYDGDRFPHLVRLHGILADVLTAHVPDEALPWLRRIASMGPAPEAPEIRRTVMAWALRAQGGWGCLARFALFEVVCLNQRLLLAAEAVRLEHLGGSRDAIEALAQRELDAAVALDAAGVPLLEAEDPMKVVVAAAFDGLNEHVDYLRHLLTEQNDEVREAVVRRQLIIEVADALEPADGILLVNDLGWEPGEEELAPADLRRRHALVLGAESDANLYQRRHRLPEKIRRLRAKKVPVRRGPTVADIILGEGRRGGGR